MSFKMCFAVAVVGLAAAAMPALAQTAGSAPAPAAAQAPAAASADTGPSDPVAKARWQACQPDVVKFCGTVDRAVKGAMKTCLESHAAELSAACKTARAERAAEKATEKK